MVKAVQWLLCTYLALKFLQYFFVARPGFGTAEPGFRDKLLRGEPVVALVACAIAIPAALGSSWYVRHGYESSLERAADCYGRLGALSKLGEIESQFDALQVFRASRRAQQSAALAARSLALPPDRADTLLADRLAFHTRRYAALSRRADRPAMRLEAAAVERCVSEPLINF